MLGSIASLDFSRTLEISDKADNMDAVAAGLNMLSEELQANVVERSKLEAIVTELEVANQELQAFSDALAHDLRNPLLIVTAQSWNLLYQFWIHTERIDKMPRWFEAVLNTPSHHRVHHATNPQYIDKNYAGILIVWDRLFGTFEPEVERPVYGLTSNIGSYNPLVIAFHEWRDMLRDIAAAPSGRDRIGFALRGPGWAYERRRALAASRTDGAAA